MTLLEQIAQERTNQTIHTAVSATIEKIATDAAREMLKDPLFRAQMKAAARQSFDRALRDLRKENGRASRSRPRKGGAR